MLISSDGNVFLLDFLKVYFNFIQLSTAQPILVTLVHKVGASEAPPTISGTDMNFLLRFSPNGRIF